MVETNAGDVCAGAPQRVTQAVLDGYMWVVRESAGVFLERDGLDDENALMRRVYKFAGTSKSGGIMNIVLPACVVKELVRGVVVGAIKAHDDEQKEPEEPEECDEYESEDGYAHLGGSEAWREHCQDYDGLLEENGGDPDGFGGAR